MFKAKEYIFSHVTHEYNDRFSNKQKKLFMNANK